MKIAPDRITTILIIIYFQSLAFAQGPGMSPGGVQQGISQGPGPANPSQGANHFESLVQSYPMVVALLFQGETGALEGPFTEASQTPRFRFSEIQFIKAERGQPGVEDILAKNQIFDEDLPIIVLFRDGKIVADDKGQVTGLAHQATTEEIRDFVDDYFSDLINGIMKYSQENPNNFQNMPTQQVLYSDYASDYAPAVSYQPIIYNSYTSFHEPIWWGGFFGSSYYYPYWQGYRPHWDSWRRPPWYRYDRPNRFDRWNRWRDRGDRWDRRRDRRDRWGDRRDRRDDRRDRWGDRRDRRDDRRDRWGDRRDRRDDRRDGRDGRFTDRRDRGRDRSGIDRRDRVQTQIGKRDSGGQRIMPIGQRQGQGITRPRGQVSRQPAQQGQIRSLNQRMRGATNQSMRGSTQSQLQSTRRQQPRSMGQRQQSFQRKSAVTSSKKGQLTSQRKSLKRSAGRRR